MSELIAWGDESVQTQGGVIPTYYRSLHLRT